MYAEFVDGPKGKLFCLVRRPSLVREGNPAVLMVPPFGEEQNKSRAVMADCARRFAESGITAVQFDLFGTGDSEGDFSAASWATWQRDVAAVYDWTEAQGLAARYLYGIRSGCCLVSDFLQERKRGDHTAIFIQPVTNGSLFFKQFLRLRVAASVMSSASPETAKELLERFAAGETLRIAGYDINPTLAREIQGVTIDARLAGCLARLIWLEVSRTGGAADISVASRRVADSMLAAGLAVDTTVASGEPFWSATEIVRNPTLVERLATSLEL